MTNNQSDESECPSERINAAEYVRMSTDLQQYSTTNQSTALRKFAAERGYRIVRTYADEGKSGLSLSGRSALQSLLDDIASGRADYQAVLVYDVSRWGRFQDPDEAAAIELTCRQSGVDVHYCAEQFENDGSIGSSIIKTVKRAMAGEYSRELSEKVFNGQANLIRRGYRQGGSAGFGLRRMLVDKDGCPKMLLRRGEHKSIATDRIILVPGPKSEVEIVNKIYRLFAIKRRSESKIAETLNKSGSRNDFGRPWTQLTVRRVLQSEKYIGNNVWARKSRKLKTNPIANPRDEWIRANGVFEGIVPITLFEQAQHRFHELNCEYSDDELLEFLREILRGEGTLSGILIDEYDAAPSHRVFQRRFGSLTRAYRLVGFTPQRDYRYVEVNRRLRTLHREQILEIEAVLSNVGASYRIGDEHGIFVINEELLMSTVVARCQFTSANNPRWHIRFDTSKTPDLTVVVRMQQDNRRPLDYYIIPRIDLVAEALRLCQWNGVTLDSYRSDSLSKLGDMALRMRIPMDLAA